MQRVECDRRRVLGPLEEPIREAVEQGFTAAKIKIGRGPDEDAVERYRDE